MNDYWLQLSLVVIAGGTAVGQAALWFWSVCHVSKAIRRHRCRCGPRLDRLGRELMMVCYSLDADVAAALADALDRRQEDDELPNPPPASPPTQE